MKTESITRKRLPDIIAHDVSFVCVQDNLIVLEFDDHGETRRISFCLELADLAVSQGKLDARRKELENRELEMEEQFRQSNEPTETPNF
jgi:hypothetical protein